MDGYGQRAYGGCGDRSGLDTHRYLGRTVLIFVSSRWDDDFSLGISGDRFWKR